MQQFLFNPECICCGSFFNKEHLFCDKCFSLLILSKLQPTIRSVVLKHSDQELKIKHIFLIKWIPEESDLVSRLVYYLKSDRCWRASQYYSAILIKAFEKELSKIDLIVCVPGSSKKSHHSFIIANFIGKTINKPVFNFFQKTSNFGLKDFFSQTEQKRLNLNRRRDIKIQFNLNKYEEFTKLSIKASCILVVDDIFTSGNTSFSVIKSIKHNNAEFIVLTHFFRALLS